jgi:hypothetical protein
LFFVLGFVFLLSILLNASNLLHGITCEQMFTPLVPDEALSRDVRNIASLLAIALIKKLLPWP